LSNRFLYYTLALQQNYIYNKYQVGGTIPHCYWRDLLNLEIPLPPLEIQQQIVENLDRIFADPQDMKDCLAFTDKAMDLMLKDPSGTLLEDVLGGIRLKRNHLKNATSIKTQMASIMKSVGMRGYERKKLGDVCDLNPENITKADKFERINYIDLASAKEGSLNEIQELVFNERPSRAQRKVKKNDIIWGTTRPLSKSYTFIDTDINNLIVSTGFVVIRSKDTNILLPKFLYYSSTTNECVEYLNNKSTGSTFPAFKSDDIAMYDIPLPPLETQQQILTILNEMDDERKSLEQIASKAEERAKFVLDGYLNM
jgi:type I restriction enzyme S subunit